MEEKETMQRDKKPVIQKSKKKQTNDLITYGLELIPDDFILASRKETDIGLGKLIEEYKKVSDSSSVYKDINELETGIQLKSEIDKMPFKDKLTIIWNYNSAIGRVGEDIHLAEERTFKMKMKKILFYGAFSLFMFIVSSILCLGLVRNQIDTNFFINNLMTIPNKLLDMFTGSKPTID